MEQFWEVFKWALTIIALFPVWGAMSWELWAGSIKPKLIPHEEIESIASDMIAEHGKHAYEKASIGEDRAWRYSNSFEQGKLRRVRLEVQRQQRHCDDRN